MTDMVQYSVEDIATRLCSFLRDNILADGLDINANTELSSIGVDSFSLMEVILFIERSFGVILPAESLTPENIASVQSLSQCCYTLLNKTNG